MTDYIALALLSIGMVFIGAVLRFGNGRGTNHFNALLFAYTWSAMLLGGLLWKVLSL